MQKQEITWIKYIIVKLIKKIPNPWGGEWDFDIYISLEKCIVKFILYHTIYSKTTTKSHQIDRFVYHIGFNSF